MLKLKMYLLLQRYINPENPAVLIALKFIVARTLGNSNPVFLANENRNMESIPVIEANTIWKYRISEDIVLIFPTSIIALIRPNINVVNNTIIVDIVNLNILSINLGHF